MAIKVTRAIDPIEVKTLCMTIYSQPAVGKTSLAFTASRPLLLDFDDGVYRAVDRKDAVRPESWADVAAITAQDVADYDTIIVDTAGKALDFLAQDIMKSNPRLGYGGALNQQGWGQLGTKFGAFLRLVRGFGKDVVLIAHMDEQKDGDAIKERLKVQGGSKDLILTDSDVIARISIHNKARELMFSPTETSFGKDPAGLVSRTIPDKSAPEFKTCLADILRDVKNSLNSQTEAQSAHAQEVQWFRNTLPHITTAESINEILGRAKRGGRDIAKMVVDRAAELQLEYDAAKGGYVYLEEMTIEEAGPDVGDGENM